MARKIKIKKEEDKKENHLFPLLNSISHSKNDMIESGETDIKEYKPFMINRFLSFSADTALYAQGMNENYWLDPKMQYDYLRYAIRSQKRFFKYIKPDKEDDIVKLVAEYHGISLRKAREYAAILSTDEINYIIKRLDKGGTAR